MRVVSDLYYSVRIRFLFMYIIPLILKPQPSATYTQPIRNGIPVIHLTTICYGHLVPIVVFGSSEILAVFGVHSFGYTAGLPLLIAVIYVLYRTGVNPIKKSLT